VWEKGKRNRKDRGKWSIKRKGGGGEGRGGGRRKIKKDE
jgi:hypothetical protein